MENFQFQNLVFKWAIPVVLDTVLNTINETQLEYVWFVLQCVV